MANKDHQVGRGSKRDPATQAVIDQIDNISGHQDLWRLMMPYIKDGAEPEVILERFAEHQRNEAEKQSAAEEAAQAYQAYQAKQKKKWFKRFATRPLKKLWSKFRHAIKMEDKDEWKQGGTPLRDGLERELNWEMTERMVVWHSGNILTRGSVH